jgi:hypothetical protein
MLLMLSVLALALVAGSGAGLAYPTLGGPTGGAVLPDAMVVPPGQLDLAWDWTKINQAAGLEMYDITVMPLRVVYGAGSGAELWGAWTRIDNGESVDGWGFGAKYQFMREPKDSVNLAAGAGWNRLENSGEETVWNAYLVATKDLTPTGTEGWAWEPEGTKILGSLGVLWMDFDEFNESLFEPFVALDFIGARGTSLGLEYRFKDSSIDDKAVFSAVVRHPFTQNLSLQVGVTNGAIGGIGLEDMDLFAGICYRTGVGTRGP